MEPERLRAQGERELAEKLRANPVVAKAIEAAAKAEPSGARRQLLATALRLTPEIAPDIAESIAHSARALSLSRSPAASSPVRIRRSISRCTPIANV